jgi:asparagine synthase (glutamine-hydrolysing)
MCGINGIYAFHPSAGSPAEAEVLRTRDAMHKRGPDGFGLWTNEDRRCMLAHRRLSFLDLSDRSAQPMLSVDERLALTYNGEIYNFPELRAELEAQGVTFRTTSDTEALLHLYARDGQAMVQKLRGMFALAIWDVTQQGLFLARDPYGIKPLYIANDGWTLRFASQVRALLAGGGVSRDPEPAGVVGFHLWGSVPEPFTLYRDIRALPAGHTQWIDRAGPRTPQPYVRLASILAEGAKAPLPESQIAPQVRDAVRESVAAHLLADVEVGVFLSAGVDSGAMLGLMRDAGCSNATAITLAFEEFRGTSEDEAPLAAQVAQIYGARHIVRTVGEAEFREDLPAILAAMDQPSMDGVNTWFVSKAACEAGLKAAISGLGGDELLAGYASFRDMPRWRRRFGPLASVPGFGGLARAVMGALVPGFVRANPKALSMLEYAGSWEGAYLLRRGLFLPHELPSLLDRDFVVEGMRRLKPLTRLSGLLSPDPHSNNGRICVLESEHYMRNQLLRDADWAGMAHSLEIRTPLVDIKLLKKLAPAIAALKPGMGKAALAAAPSVPLPQEIVSRAKTGFGVPTRSWMAAAARANREEAPEAKGLTSRRWSRKVLEAFTPTMGDLAL